MNTSCGVGVVVPYDFALDRELWRWAPENVTLRLNRTAYSPLPVSAEQAVVVGDVEEVGRLAREVSVAEPQVALYLCTSGSFVHGRAGERALVAAMRAAGFPIAVTTSGALLEALSALDVGRVAVATPYDPAVTALLEAFLAEAGVAVSRSAHLGLSERIWTVDHATTAELVRSAVTGTEDAVFISCTNLATFDLVPVLEAELGIPVLTANQVSMWAALCTQGLRSAGTSRLEALR